MAFGSKESATANDVASPRIDASESAYVNMARLSADDPHKHHNESSHLEAEEEHRKRFLSDAERLIADHPMDVRESFQSMTATDERKWHAHSADEVAILLETDFERGLTPAEHAKRLDVYGPNSLEADPRAPLWVTFLLQFYNLIIMILLIAAVFSFILTKYVEAVAILVIVFINAVVATAQERSANNALDALALMASPQSLVIRDGQEVIVESDQLVPGDIVLLVTGDVVPADIRLIHSVDLKVNEMLLTGESEDVSKKANASLKSTGNKLTADNMAFSSTTVTAGNARAVVCETGMSTRVGAIALLLKSKTGGDQDGAKKSKCRNPVGEVVAKYQPKMTPLQKGLHKLGFTMGGIALTACTLVFIVGLIVGTKDLKNPDRAPWVALIMVAVSLAVSAVPEGLPMVVTICLSVGTSDMVKKHVLVRKLAAVETLGAASVICTDKTGTLTEGKMTAVHMWGDFKTYDITGKGFNPEGGIFLDGENQVAPGSTNVQARATLLACVLCSNTHLRQEEVNDVMTWVPMGNSSEAPLVVAAAKAGIWEEYVTQQYKRVLEVPFSSSRKMMVTLNELPANGMFDSWQVEDKARFVACVKGAPNYILNNCTQYMRTDGTIATLTDDQREQVMQAVDDLSSKALRVLAVAARPLAEIPFASDCDDVDEKFAALSQPLILMGLMASIDPERDGVRDAIQTARTASIRTVMITGDYVKTAVAIAQNIELIHRGAAAANEAVDCSTLRPRGDYLPEEELDEITSRASVFARARPEDKIEIVKSLQRQGLVSAMTGDGVNDAPALKEADIGVAMGIAGTEVAKGASDMVLLDDNFCSIVTAVEKGRVIYANIQKFVVFFLSTNIGQVVLLFTSIAFGLPLPLEPLQILMMNLLTDGMPGAALSMETGDPNIMEDTPRPKEQHVIHGELWTIIGLNAIFVYTSTALVFLIGLYWNFGLFFLDDIIATGTGPVEVAGKVIYTGVTCNRWEGMDRGWRLYGNCGAQFANGTALFELYKTASKIDLPSFYCESGAYTCMDEGLSRAQTMTFFAITLTGVLRAYTVRSFTHSMFQDLFGNRHLQYASIVSIGLTIIMTCVPWIMTEIFGFAYIAWWQWLVAYCGSFLMAFMSETAKYISRRRAREAAKWANVHNGLDTVLTEIRLVRSELDQARKAAA